MTGPEFNKWRKLVKLKAKMLSDIFGYRTLASFRYHLCPKDENQEAPRAFELFYNYANRYGLKKAIVDFKKRLK